MPRRGNPARLVAAAATLALGSAVPLAGAGQIVLRGGHFYGPGPIEPDAKLPDGRLVNVQFDRRTFLGQTGFRNDGSPGSVFSDGRTRINQNIEAGLIKLGDGRETVLLAAVADGPHEGAEIYYLDESYNMIWRVDLALDPGFEQGIIRVDDFVLTTGVVRIQDSLQTQRRQPGGYDQAGSLKAGRYLAGRLGDFDQNGYLDGIVVAAPHVPMEANLLPGSPVGNYRGFETDVELPAHLAAELTLRSIKNFVEPLRETAARPDLEEFRRLQVEIGIRLRAARGNMQRALQTGLWRDHPLKDEGYELTWRLDAMESLNMMALSFSGEPYVSAGAAVPASVVDVTRRLFVELDPVLQRLSQANRSTGDVLPEPQRRAAGGGERP